MEDNIVLDWTYSPTDFFEQDISIPNTDYVLEIRSGSVQARVSLCKFAEDGSTRDKIHAALDRRFRAVQALSHRAYVLNGPSQYRSLPDGRRQHTLFVHDSESVVQCDTVDLVVKNSDGDVIADSRADRLREKRQFAERVAVLGEYDVLLQGLLESYSNAVRDCADELVHLYEIRDALAKHFGGEQKARDKLSITKRRWSRIGQLANDEPIRQGRHRGRSLASMRDATDEELQECRNIALELIANYLQYAESQTHQTANNALQPT
jgi:hypothetical protein